MQNNDQDRVRIYPVLSISIQPAYGKFSVKWRPAGSRPDTLDMIETAGRFSRGELSCTIAEDTSKRRHRAVFQASRVIALLAFCLFCMTALNADAEPVTVAVASNFARAGQDIVASFATESGQTVQITSASTGKLYAQISNGAPFDVFLAADAERPRLLEAAGRGVAGSRFTYAIGRLVLWSRDPALAGTDCRNRLNNLGASRLAIANPDTAPYGVAAREMLTGLGLWERVESQLVRGENIAQTLQFVASGNVSLGLIARAQATDARLPPATCSWPVPSNLHGPILHPAILLKRSAAASYARPPPALPRRPVARWLLLGTGSARRGDKRPAAACPEFWGGPMGGAIVARHGYALPD